MYRNDNCCCFGHSDFLCFDILRIDLLKGGVNRDRYTLIVLVDCKCRQNSGLQLSYGLFIHRRDEFRRIADDNNPSARHFHSRNDSFDQRAEDEI